MCSVTDLNSAGSTHCDCQYVQHVQVLSYTESNLNYTECWISYLIALLKLARVKRGVDRRREKLLPVMLCIPPSAAQHMSREQEREWDLSENEDKRQCERLRLQAVRMKRKRQQQNILSAINSKLKRWHATGFRSAEKCDPLEFFGPSLSG